MPGTPATTGQPRDRLGRALHDLRISVTDRCNFRCPYCMPRERFPEHYAFLNAAQQLSFAEITRLARLFVPLGVRKLRLTGGEPLLRPKLAELVAELATIQGIEDLALTTNGALLARHARELRAAGLQRVTVSLDSLDPAVFARLSGGLGSVEQVLAGLAGAQAAGFTHTRINTVVQRGVNDDGVLALVEHFRGTGMSVRFIEYMDVGNRNDWQPSLVVPSRELQARIHARWPLHPLTPAYPGEVARRYAFDDGAGEIGFISSVTQPFCGACSRIRLSSDGRLYTCLFAHAGTDLRAALRDGTDDDGITAILRNTWLGREDRYSEQRAQLRARKGGERKIEMNYIGG